MVAKRPGQILADYFTSLLVLSSAIRFKPVRNKQYFLYFEGGTWRLSLISPEEWDTDEKRNGYVGACELHDDSTWSIEPSDNLGQPGPVTDALAAAYDSFMDRLKSGQPLEDGLPRYESRLPYYQRLFAAALGRSLERSIRSGGQAGTRADTWLRSLPVDPRYILKALSDGR